MEEKSGESEVDGHTTEESKEIDSVDEGRGSHTPEKLIPNEDGKSGHQDGELNSEEEKDETAHSSAVEAAHEESDSELRLDIESNATRHKEKDEIASQETDKTAVASRTEVERDSSPTEADSDNSKEKTRTYSLISPSSNGSINSSEISSMPLAPPVKSIDLSDREVVREGSESQTSFVNEYALNNNSDSPTYYEEDRNIERFSEILLDSDASPNSDKEEEPVDDHGGTSLKKKYTKKVRFADEVVTKDLTDGDVCVSPPPPPSSLPSLPAPGSNSRHPGVPITPSPTSPQNKFSTCTHTIEELISGVEMAAEYLGSTPITMNGIGAMKTARMFQAQRAVQLIKDPENDSRPRFAVKLKISTGAIKIADSSTDVDLMDHPLHTITYVADIDHVLVIMAYVRPPPISRRAPPTSPPASENNGEEEVTKFIPKMTCHVLDTANAREVAMVIGQAFSGAYKQFLRSSGVSDEHLEQAEYAHILNAQSVPQLEVESLSDRNKIKKLIIPKHKNEIMGMMVMESGYGSAIPTCVIVHLSKTGSAFKSSLLNVGDHILSINNVNLVGIPRKACMEQIKKCRPMNVVKMEVCSCSTVVDVTIVRPDLKYQLGFTINEGMICALVRGSIAERSGVRIGHTIIDINGTSTVGMQHSDIVHLLSSTVGDLHIRIMPDIMYRLLIGKLQPEYC